MARTIQSPGVEINEFDLSIRNVGSPATTVFIPGFAANGPSSEPISVTSISEFESIFGTPTNSAERYFYHTVKAVLQSPASVLVYRLPYGEGTGLDTSDEYSALVYPVGTYSPSQDVLGTSLTPSDSVYLFGSPTHLKLTQGQYLSLLRGDAFTWATDTQGVVYFTDLGTLSAAGMIVLNKAQSTINSKFEGTYLGIIDNTNLNPATPFNDINSVLSINSEAASISNSEFFTEGAYVEVPDVRLNFTLSADSGALQGSVSEVLENIASFDISSDRYDDTIIMGVFKLRQSVFSPDTIALDYILQEGYTGSLDANRQINSENGGPAISFFVEIADQASTNITTIINPYISNKNSTTWLNMSGAPTKKVRFLSQQLVTPLNGETYNEYLTRVGAPSAIVIGAAGIYGQTNSLFALGDYSNQDLSTKVIGNVPAKVTLAAEKMSNVDLFPLTITTEAGLGTIYANSFNPSTYGYFDDTVPYKSLVDALTIQNPPTAPAPAVRYTAVANAFLGLAESRKDHMFIADALTNIFVQGANVKTLDQPNTSFSTNIYWPLRNQFAAINTSYACAFANIVKVADIGTNQQIWVPFSGFAAAAMANTDNNFQPWFAPAGFTRGVLTGVSDLGVYPKQKNRDNIYKISLNPVAFFPSEGYVIFGQKTLQKIPSAFDRINVRRLFLSLETSTRDTVKYFLFEPNTLFTRTQIINSLTPIFDNAKNTQGIYDYLLICDERNNTPAVIDDNTIVVDIYVKPVRAAEYILCNFYCTRTGTTFQEIVT
jgi:hypothetical protein